MIINVDKHPKKSLLASLGWIENWGGIPVDACISDEIKFLLDSGVITVGCCCGHHKSGPNCLIDKDSVELARELGYSPQQFRPGEPGFEDRLEMALRGDSHE